jgi:hypothetical protein
VAGGLGVLAHLLYPLRVPHLESPEQPADPYAPPRARDAGSGQAVPWLRDSLLLLALQIGLTVAASATSWFTVREPRYTLVFAAIPAGAMVFAFIRRRRALMQEPGYRMLLALAGAIGWGMMSGLLAVWIKFATAAGTRLRGTTLFVGFVFVWVYYVAATLFGLWSGSHHRATRGSLDARRGRSDG